MLRIIINIRQISYILKPLSFLDILQHITTIISWENAHKTPQAL